ncbi:MAG: hypothetical protein ACFE7R_08470 [Candidatus Hodarchaeota archaeon]
MTSLEEGILYRNARFLPFLYIIPLCCWTFDVITTLYAINYLRVAGEMNPLGWPFGAWGALIFYCPALIFTFFLSSRKQGKLSIWVAAVITAIAIGLGLMNLAAGIHNIGVASLYL